MNEDQIVNEDQDTSISFVMSKPEKMGKIEYWLKRKKRTPKIPDSARDLFGGQHRLIDDCDWKVGEEYLTRFGQRVTVLKHELVFMGYSALVQYENGAIRWNSYSEFLYSVEPELATADQ